IKFGLLTLTTRPRESFTAAAQLDHPSRLREPGRTYRLSAGQVARLNPNTLHCPTFASARDADLVARLHDRLPVLVRDEPPAHPPVGRPVGAVVPQDQGRAAVPGGGGAGGRGLAAGGERLPPRGRPLPAAVRGEAGAGLRRRGGDVRGGGRLGALPHSRRGE